MLVEQKLPVRFMYHEAPDAPSDSGWRFFSGYETQGYVDLPANIGLYGISTILDIDPSIEPYLSRGKGNVAFTRESDTGGFSVSETFPCLADESD